MYSKDNHDFLTKKIFSAGEFLIHQNKLGKNVFVVQSGITKCFVNEENGRDFIQEFFGEGEILGEIEVLTDTLSFSNVNALTEVHAFKIKRDDFYTLLKTKKELELLILKALALKVRDTAIRAAQQQLHPLEHNLKQLLNLISDQGITFSKKNLADYLGITLRSLNRSMKKLENEKP